MEINLKIDTPELTTAIERLAAALEVKNAPQGGEEDKPAKLHPEPPKPAQAEKIKPPAPGYTLDQLARAGVGLRDKGKLPEIVGLLQKYGAAAMGELKPEQFGAFAEDLRGLGADI